MNGAPELVAAAHRVEQEEANIKAAIDRVTAKAVRALAVIRQEGCLLLSGQCSQYYDKKEAQDTAMGLMGGVCIIINKIQVK